MAGILSKIVQRLDSESVIHFSDIDYFGDQKNWISTGSPILDYNLRTMGYPAGIVEVRGASQSGKTTFSLEAMKACINAYKDRAIVTILSSERRDNKDLAHQIGVDVDNVIIAKTRTIEKMFSEMSRIVDETNKIWKEAEIEGRPRFLFVWDSLGQTVAKQEAEALDTRKNAKRGTQDEDKNAAMGAAARAISLGLRGAASLMDENEITFFIINRAYDNMGSPGKSSYGGKAMEFWPTMRLELVRVESFKTGETEIGQRTQVYTVKTDFDRPKQKFNVEIGYGYGIVLGKDDIEFGIKHGILKKHGAYGAKFNDKLSWQNRKDLYQHYENKTPMLKVLLTKLTKKAHELVEKERAEKLNK